MSEARAAAGFLDCLGAQCPPVGGIQEVEENHHRTVLRPASLNCCLAVWSKVTLTLAFWLFPPSLLHTPRPK